MRACWLKWVGRDWSISADYIWLNYSGANSAIAAYNAGMGNVDGWAQQSTSLHNAITFPETQAYLIRVNNAWVRYKTLYPDRFV